LSDFIGALVRIAVTEKQQIIFLGQGSTICPVLWATHPSRPVVRCIVPCVTPFPSTPLIGYEMAPIWYHHVSVSGSLASTKNMSDELDIVVHPLMTLLSGRPETPLPRWLVVDGIHTLTVGFIKSMFRSRWDPIPSVQQIRLMQVVTEIGFPSGHLTLLTLVHEMQKGVTGPRWSSDPEDVFFFFFFFFGRFYCPFVSDSENDR
jgi:hypothetical protein